jgi:transposase
MRNRQGFRERYDCDSLQLEVNHMGKSHSVDLRQRVVAMVASGQSRRAAARHFGVSNSSAIKLLQRQNRNGTIAPARQGRPPGSGKLSAYRDFLVAQVEEKPDITMPELARRLEEKHGVVVPPSSLSRFLILQGFTYKKTADGIGTRTR